MLFLFFFLIQQAIGGARGYTTPFVQAYPVRQFVAHQMIGGILVFGVSGLWGARALFVEVVRRATGVRAARRDGVLAGNIRPVTGRLVSQPVVNPVA